jgi:hypothetical protein
LDEGRKYREKAQNLENRVQSACFLSQFRIGQIFEVLSPTGC